MKWLLFTNMETDIDDNIIRVRCCLTDCKFNKLVFVKDFETDKDITINIIENEIIRYINDNVALKDKIYLICNLKSSIINDSKLINRQMLKLSKYIRETLDLSSLWMIIEMYSLYDNIIGSDNIDYCIYNVYGFSNISSNNIKNDIMI